MVQELYEIRPDGSHQGRLKTPSSCPSPQGEKDRLASLSTWREGRGEGVLGSVPPELASLHQRLDGCYRKGFMGQWRAYAINGAFSVLAGLISLILPIFLNSQALALAGGILVLRGALTVVSALSAPPPAGFAISLLSGFLFLPAGICLMLDIFTDSISFIWLFSAYFASAGIATLLLAASCRRRHCGHWEWLAVSGVLNLELALIALSRLPEDFIWVLIIFLGLDFIAHGSALLAVALTSNDEASQRAGG